MSLLDGLFDGGGGDALTIASPRLTASATIMPRYLYELQGSDDDVSLTIVATLNEAAGNRIAVKVITEAPTPPGGVLRVLAPSGQLIEGDDGTLSSNAVFTGAQAIGGYREWHCDPNGNWIMVAGATGGGGGGVEAPPASTYELGGDEEINIGGLSGTLADPQLVQVQSSGAVVAERAALNFIGATVTDEPGAERVNVTLPGAPIVAAQTAGASAIATHPTPADIPGLSFSLSSIGTYLIELQGKAVRNPAHTTARLVVRPSVLTGAMTFSDAGDLWAYDHVGNALRFGSVASMGSDVGIPLPAAVAPVLVHLTLRVTVTALVADACTFKMQVQGSALSTTGDQVQLDNALCRITKFS
jgi:hypothetical protein